MPAAITQVGEYATTENSPVFINSQPIAINCVGLKPNTVVNLFFDKKSINSYVRSAYVDPAIAHPKITDFYTRSPFGGTGGVFKTDAEGKFVGIFSVPARTFFTGDRELIIADVASIDNLPQATTQSVVVFKTFNYTQDSTDSSFVSPKPSDSQAATLTNKGSGSSTRAGIFNPLCFRFYVGTEDAEGADGIYITAVDLYFRRKSSTKGIVFDVRTVENGVPTTTVIPGSRIKFAPANINVSENGSTVTKVTFPTPIYVRAGYEYAIAMSPDGASPDYVLWTATVGEKDITQNTTVKRNWGEGALFTSTNGSVWVPIQNEFPKFKLYRASFNTSPSSVKMTNSDYEFFTIHNNTTDFEHGEWAFQVAANASGNVTFSTNSNIILGTGTAFLTDLSVNGKFVLSNGSMYDVVTVNTIANNSYVTIKEYPRFVANSTVIGKYIKTPVGQVSSYNTTLGELVLDNSTAANSTFRFTTGSTIRGEITNSTATITNINDKIVNKFLPTIQTSVPQGATLGLKASALTSNYASYSEKTYNLNGTNYLSDNEVVVASKTNEILYNSGNKSFSANLTLSTTSPYITPVVDTEDSGVYVIRNLINDTSYNENTSAGSAISRYISSKVSLKENLDSEDIQVYISGYRPTGTDIEVYAKIINSSDPESFESKDWSLLQNDTPDIFSDIGNINDFKEYRYQFMSSPASYNKAGVLSVSSSSTTVQGTGASFYTSTIPGDVLKVYSDSSSNTFAISKVVNNYILSTGTISCNNTSTTVSGTGTNFISSNGFVSGAKLYVGSNRQVVGIINAVSNTTTLTLTANAFLGATAGFSNVATNSFFTDSFIVVDTAPQFTSTNAVWERITVNNAAYKNPQNDGIVRYYSKSGAAYDSYRAFAIKIVLKSNTSYRVPRVDDMRVTALSV